MNGISTTDWSFEAIREADADRALRLEACAGAGELLTALTNALHHAIDHNGVRCVIDSCDNKFAQCRSTVQFPVPIDVCDWFFNGRTGYRAQYWRAPKTGLDYNTSIVCALVEVLKRLPNIVEARKIHLIDPQSHEECDVGLINVSRERFLRSFAPKASKLWLAERLYTGKLGCVSTSTILFAAVRYDPKLIIPRWEHACNPDSGEVGEGLRAPVPGNAEESWIDMKGGFVIPGDEPIQIKPPSTRALQIHECGWS